MRERIRPAIDAFTVLSALELIELGILTERSFAGLGSKQAIAVVSQSAGATPRGAQWNTAVYTDGALRYGSRR